MFPITPIPQHQILHVALRAPDVSLVALLVGRSVDREMERDLAILTWILGWCRL